MLVFDYLSTGPRERLRLVAHPVTLRRGGNASLVGAVEALIDHRPARGHATVWRGLCRPGVGVRSVEVGRVVTVTLRGFGPDGSVNPICHIARTAVLAQQQQLAWTVRAALHRDVPVRVVLRGGVQVWRATRARTRYLDPQTAARVLG